MSPPETPRTWSRCNPPPKYLATPRAGGGDGFAGEGGHTGGLSQRLSHCAGWYLRVYALFGVCGNNLFTWLVLAGGGGWRAAACLAMRAHLLQGRRGRGHSECLCFVCVERSLWYH